MVVGLDLNSDESVCGTEVMHEGLDLAAQPADVHIDDIGLRVE